MAIGVPRPLAIEKPQAVDLVQAARYFGAHGEPDAATLALLQKCAVPLLAVAMPRAVWLLADTPALTEAGLLPGEDVHKHLAGCGQAILLAVTLGPGVDAQIRAQGGAVRHRHQPDDPAQERDCPAGGQRPPGKGTTGRVRPLCAAHPLRIQKEGKDLCK